MENEYDVLISETCRLEDTNCHRPLKYDAFHISLSKKTENVQL